MESSVFIFSKMESGTRITNIIVAEKCKDKLKHPQFSAKGKSTE